jgi:hypothetical protein
MLFGSWPTPVFIQHIIIFIQKTGKLLAVGKFLISSMFMLKTNQFFSQVTKTFYSYDFPVCQTSICQSWHSWGA